MYGYSIPQNVSDRLLAQLHQVAERDDVPFLACQLAPIPSTFRPRLIREYSERFESAGRRSANLWTHDVAKLFTGRGLSYAADDSEIRDTAEQAARHVRSKLKHCTSEEITVQVLSQAAQRYDIPVPLLDSLEKIVQRMSAEKWWRRQLRGRFRKIEAAAIRTGFVHRRAGLYASDETVNRRIKQKRRNAKLLESLEAVHDQTGEVCTLSDLAATNVSNPVIRRTELMTRISGMEEFAGWLGYVGLFLTITTPSRMHARRFDTGEVNPSYTNTRPDVAQRYLLKKVWAPVQAKLQREGVDYFGLRVVEPHHDGTPHWHMLAFVKPGQKDHFVGILRDYALRDTPDEPGAQERRFTAVPIDPAKGSATGYVAKYIAKNIDGHAVGDDFEADQLTDASETSVRVDAWASLWNIRQFQFFGVPSVTPYRELRRLGAVPEHLGSLLADLWMAADAGDWKAYMQLHREGARAKPLWEERPSSTYFDEMTKRVRGVVLNGGIRLETRQGEWLVREKDSVRRERLSSPWTRVNNSTHHAQKGIGSEEVLTFDRNGSGEKGVTGGISLPAGNRQEPGRQLAQKGGAS